MLTRALFIDNNDNDMTVFGNIVYLRNSGFELQFFQSTNACRAKTKVMEEISSQNSDLG